MSQSHDSLATRQLVRSAWRTWLIGFGCRFSLMPICAALDCSCSIAELSQLRPLANAKLKLRVLPLAIPGPHLEGSVQVVVPPGATVQPWLDSSALALAMLNGDGPCSDLVAARPAGDRNLLTGTFPTGPTVGEP